MNLIEYKKLHIPDSPGVYIFKSGVDVLYIGKATSLRERLRSYFNDDVIATRGRLIVDMVTRAISIEYETTDSVLEAFIRETELIKKYQPPYNSKDKDNKSFNYVVITKEEFPRVLSVRGRDLEKDVLSLDIHHSYGPYPHGGELKEALKIIRKIFPFRDMCVPCVQNSNTHKTPKPCFNRSINLCPGVCTGEISSTQYKKTIQHIHLFFTGKKKKILKTLELEMMKYAKTQEFERAGEIKKTIFALEHIKDVSMIKREIRNGMKIEEYTPPTTRPVPAYVVSKKHLRHIVQDWKGIEAERQFRIESYDVAHMSGKNMVGVMVVSTNFEFDKTQYRKFIIKEYEDSNDIGALKEIVKRRFTHLDWKWPDMIIVDGGELQRNAVLKLVSEIYQNYKLEYPELSTLTMPCVVSVVKDGSHKAKAILGATDDQIETFDNGSIHIKTPPVLEKMRKTLSVSNLTRSQIIVGQFKIQSMHIISLNEETHRFAITFHKKKRSENFLPKK